MLDSRYANGFLVQLLSGCLALDGNLVKSLSILFSLMSTNVDTLAWDKWDSDGYDYSGGYYYSGGYDYSVGYDYSGGY